MTRPEFLAALIGGATAVKAVAETMPDGSAPKAKRLLVIECDHALSADHMVHIKQTLAPYEERYGIEFMVLDSSLRVVDPNAPVDTEKILDSLGCSPERTIAADRDLYGCH